MTLFQFTIKLYCIFLDIIGNSCSKTTLISPITWILNSKNIDIYFLLNRQKKTDRVANIFCIPMKIDHINFCLRRHQFKIWYCFIFLSQEGFYTSFVKKLIELYLIEQLGGGAGKMAKLNQQQQHAQKHPKQHPRQSHIFFVLLFENLQNVNNFIPSFNQKDENIFRKIIKNMEIDHITLPCLQAAFYPEMAVNAILLTDHPLYPPEVQNLVEYFERILENDERKVIPSKRTRQMKQQQFHAQSETHRKYKKYSFQFKRKIVMEVQGILPKYEGKINECIREKAREHKIHPKNVFRWVHSGKLVRREGGRQAKYPVLEKKLIQFIEITPQAKRRDILAKAHKLKNQLNLKGDFCFSKGWYERFRVRISRRKKMKQIDSESEWSFSLNNKNLSTLEQQKVESLVEQI